MSTIELQIIGHGYNRGDGEAQASERLVALQKAVDGWIKTLPGANRMRKEMEAAVNASKSDPDGSQGVSEVEWVLIVDTEGSQGDASLRTSATAQVASAQRLRLDADNAEVRPDKVWPLTVTVR